MLLELNKGQRYLFYYIDKVITSKIVVSYMFRANFVNIINDHLIVEKYSIGNVIHSGFWTVRMDWIENIETLDDITLSKLNLPSEILAKIDEYIT